MDGWRGLLIVLLLVFVGQIDKKVDEVVKFIQVAQAIFANIDLFEHLVFSSGNHVLDLGIVVIFANTSKLRNWYAILLVQVR